MPLNSIFLLPFLPAVKLMGKISYTYKILFISIFFFIPLFYSSYIAYNDFHIRSNKLAHGIEDLEKNHLLYEMMIALQKLERAGLLSQTRSSKLDVMHLEASEKKTSDVHLRLLEVLDDKTKATYAGYFEKIHFALLNKDEKVLTEQIYSYQHRLLLELAQLKLDYISTHTFSISDMAYLLSVELPFSSLLTTELKILRADRHEKRKLLMRIGELKASVNKTDLVLQNFGIYKERFEELSLKYQRTFQLYTKHLFNQEFNQVTEKESDLLMIQSRIFNALEEVLKAEIEKERTHLAKEYKTFILFIVAMLSLGMYLLIGAYLNLRSTLKSFAQATSEVSKGHLKSRIKTDNSDEMGVLSQEFNGMIEELDYNHTLFNEYKKAVGSSAIIVKTDIHGVITYANKAFEYTSGYSQEELIGSTFRNMRSRSTTYEQIQELWESILSNRVYKTVFENIAKNGKSFYVESTIVPVLDRKGKISEFISIMLDITSMYKQKKTLHAQVYKDDLTSLPNRMKLIEDISNTQDAKLVIINIDGFKEINTIFGEAIGDETLQKMTVEIKDALQTHYLQLYKLSGDEFAILAGAEMSIESFREDVAMLSQNLGHTKLTCDEHEISVRMTLGAVISELHHSQRSLISMADMAMREAKRTSRPYLFYRDIASLDDDIEKNYKTIGLIEKAIKEDNVHCCYQGIIDVKTGLIDKYETLMRIDDEEGEMLAPNNFINIAKRARYYPKLTQKIFREAVFTFVKREESFAVNLSIDDIMDDSTYAFILDIVNNCGCADRIIFEFLESEEIEFNDRMLEFTTHVKRLGSKIAIDDFGSGYSNYAYLMKLGVDILKIDATLIKDLDTDENCRLITQSIIDIAHALGMQTVAEHVHSKEIADLVTSMGTDYLQGFYLHEPVCDL